MSFCANAPVIACQNYMHDLAELAFLAVYVIGAAVAVIFALRWGYRKIFHRRDLSATTRRQG